jgi:hypothetical protein
MRLFEIVGLKENTSAGTTSSGSISTIAMPLGAVQKRIPYSMFTGIETSDTTPNTPKEYKAYKKKTKL